MGQDSVTPTEVLNPSLGGLWCWARRVHVTDNRHYLGCGPVRAGPSPCQVIACASWPTVPFSLLLFWEALFAVAICGILPVINTQFKCSTKPPSLSTETLQSCGVRQHSPCVHASGECSNPGFPEQCLVHGPCSTVESLFIVSSLQNDRCGVGLFISSFGRSSQKTWRQIIVCVDLECAIYSELELI